jgi:AmiR/NasT family two-component response regulator
LAQARVVIADDDPIIRMDLREMLAGLDYSVVGEAADGLSAVNQARELRPDLVIMDIKMPELDGIEAARTLTAEDIAPVLLLTAYSEPELVQRATQAGVIGYLVKPFREAQLSPAIEVTLGRFREFQQLRKELGDVREALEARKVIDRAKGMLMDRHGLSEAEAFRRIQKRSMDTRKSMREVAEAILLASEIDDDRPPTTDARPPTTDD